MTRRVHWSTGPPTPESGSVVRAYRMRFVGGPGDGITTYHFQVWRPEAEHVDSLLASGWQPHEADAQAELSNTVLFVTFDEEVAFSWLAAEEWATTPIDDATYEE
jgi:hypothetical protein